MNAIIEKYMIKDVCEVEKGQAKIREMLYQQDHRKVKDRYASDKFYMNNFKKRKMKKK